MARHIQPLAANAREIMGYRYFMENMKAEDKEVINEFLRREKATTPGRIPYIFTVSAKYPGKFLLSYGSGRHEYVSLKPNGFEFRQRMFPDILSLINWFKEHFREVPRSHRPPQGYSMRR